MVRKHVKRPLLCVSPRPWVDDERRSRRVACDRKAPLACPWPQRVVIPRNLRAHRRLLRPAPCAASPRCRLPHGLACEHVHDDLREPSATAVCAEQQRPVLAAPSKSRARRYAPATEAKHKWWLSTLGQFPYPHPKARQEKKTGRITTTSDHIRKTHKRVYPQIVAMPPARGAGATLHFSLSSRAPPG